MKKFLFIPFVLLLSTLFFSCGDPDPRILLYTSEQSYSSFETKYVNTEKTFSAVDEGHALVYRLDDSTFANNVSAFKNDSTFKSEYVYPERISEYLINKFNIGENFANQLSTSLLENKHVIITYRQNNQLYWIMK